MSFSKQQIDIIDATPSKRLYRSIIADYGLNTALCELVDNAYDCWKSGARASLKIEITIDTAQQRICIIDNAGGVKESELSKLISPGSSSLTGDEVSIGVFGVGSKRAVVALSQLVHISSRFENEKTYRLEYSDEWLNDPDWHLPYYLIPNIDANTTKIDLSNLRFQIRDSDVEALRDHLGSTYAKILKTGGIEINLNTSPVQEVMYENWAFPGEAKPTCFEKRISTSERKDSVIFRITGGLAISGGSVGGDYGVFFYCNNRLVAKAVKSIEVGFASGLAGIPHPRMSLARVIVEFIGPSAEMPWNSSKSGINYNHHVFMSVRDDIIQTVKTYTRHSKSLQEDFDAKVKPFANGEIEKLDLGDTEKVTAGKLPPIIPSKARFKGGVIELNRRLVKKKPWTRGLYEGLIVEEMVFRQKGLEQRNRIALIILDSTLEIAFKDYLAHDISQPLADAKLRALFENRYSVHNEVKKHVLKRDAVWKKIDYYYKQRCDLVHQRSNAGVSDETISDFRQVVQVVLQKMFGLEFPE